MKQRMKLFRAETIRRLMDQFIDKIIIGSYFGDKFNF